MQGYPTIKYGDPSDLQDYNGGRSLQAMENHPGWGFISGMVVFAEFLER